MNNRALYENDSQYSAEAPAITVAMNKYEAVAFVNYDLVTKVNGNEVSVSVTGAKITKETEAEHPAFVKSLIKAIEDGKDVTKAFSNDFIIIKGEEIQKHELSQMLEGVTDPVILAMFGKAMNNRTVDSYTNYLRVVGNLYGKTATGNFPLKGVFPPSMDFKDGLQAKQCMRYASLLLAYRQGTPVEFRIRSVELAKAKQSTEDGEAFF